MRTVVVDASVVLEALLHPGEARDLLASSDPQAPHLLDLEVVSVLRRQGRAGRLDEPQAWTLLQVYGHLSIRRHATRGLLPMIWRLRHNITAYDAAYVALAHSLGCPLVTLDQPLASAPQLPCSVELISPVSANRPAVDPP